MGMVRLMENPSVTGGLWSSRGNECVWGDGDMVMLLGGVVGSVGTGLRVTVSPPKSKSFVGILRLDVGGGGGSAEVERASSGAGGD